MSLNRRIYYASTAVGIQSFDGSNGGAYVAARGVQSVGINTTFNLEQAFELGQLDIYENIQNVPDVECSLEKCLDGYAPLWTLVTQGATAATLVGRSNQRANVSVGIFADTNSTASGNQVAQVFLSGMYPSQLSYDFTVDGIAKESVTLVGNNKIWTTGSFTFTGYTASNGVTNTNPLAPEGVDRRQDMLITGCVFPNDINGIVSGVNADTGSGSYTVSFQSAKFSANLGRAQILELGRFAPYFRYVEFPVQTSSNFEAIDKGGELVSATETGIYSYNQNVLDQHIRIVMREGTVIDMGTKNKLNSVASSGGNAAKGGGNRTISYSYIGFNDMSISHVADPTIALRGTV